MKNTADYWAGKTKQNLIKSWGTPVRTFDDGKNGEILIYGEQIYANANMEVGSRIAGPNYWNYDFVYVNKEGKIYNLRHEKQNYPPQAINFQQLNGTTALTSK
jgi:hypothetical protein